MRVVPDSVVLHDKVRLVFETPGPKGHFFGYYDKSPFDETERRLLCHRVDFDGRTVEATDRAEIGYWDLDSGSYSPLAETLAFNWQQGAMLQWLPGSDCSHIVYNERFEGRFAAVIVNLAQGSRRVLPTTIYSVTPDGRYALTPRFERLYYCRPGYCYQGIEQAQWNADLPRGDGLLKMDLRSGQCETLVETAALARYYARASMRQATHYVEHVMASPDSTKFIFLHRWITKIGLIETRLYSCNLDGTALRMFPDTGVYSHAAWLTHDQFIIWGRQPGPYAQTRHAAQAARWILAPLLRIWRQYADGKVLGSVARRVRRDAMLLFSATDLSPAVVGRDKLVEDGHPGICPSKLQLLLIDTYEDAENYRRLLLFNWRTGQMVELGQFYSPEQFNCTSYRCDLHPRWGPSGQLICVDAIREGRRQMLVLDVADILAEMSAGELEPNASARHSWP